MMAQDSNKSIDDSFAFPELLEPESLAGIASHNPELAAFSESLEKWLESDVLGKLTTNSSLGALVGYPRIGLLGYLASLNTYTMPNIQKAAISYLSLALISDLAVGTISRFRNIGKEVQEPIPLLIFEVRLYNLCRKIFYDGPKGFFYRHYGRKEMLEKHGEPYLEVKAVSVE